MECSPIFMSPLLHTVVLCPDRCWRHGHSYNYRISHNYETTSCWL